MSPGIGQVYVRTGSRLASQGYKGTRGGFKSRSPSVRFIDNRIAPDQVHGVQGDPGTLVSHSGQ